MGTRARRIFLSLPSYTSANACFSIASDLNNSAFVAEMGRIALEGAVFKKRCTGLGNALGENSNHCTMLLKLFAQKVQALQPRC